jgi:hypothetical protein
MASCQPLSYICNLTDWKTLEESLKRLEEDLKKAGVQGRIASLQEFWFFILT